MNVEPRAGNRTRLNHQQHRFGARFLKIVMFVTVMLIIVIVASPATVMAHDAVPHGADIMGLVRFDQHLDEKIPANLTFLDEEDRPITFGALHAQRPMILALSYFECETLCPMVRQGLDVALRSLSLDAGKDFEVVIVSIDPTESASVAQRVKQETMAAYGRSGSENGFHFLRADHKTIDQLADLAGFRYAYDGEQDEYAHPSGILLVTPQGRISSYFFGIEYNPKDLRLGLVEASNNQIGTPIDRLLLLCYHYDPAAGSYSLLVMNVVRMAGLLTIALLAVTIFVLWRKDSQRAVTLG